MKQDNYGKFTKISFIEKVLINSHKLWRNLDFKHCRLWIFKAPYKKNYTLVYVYVNNSPTIYFNYMYFFVFHQYYFQHL